jgi:hypothetical protein
MRNRMWALTVGVMVWLALGGWAGAADLAQAIHLHAGKCDGPEHWNIPVLTNPYPGPIQIVSTRVILGGDIGYRWAFLSIRGMWLAWAHDEGNAYSLYKDIPQARLMLQPGETVHLNHHCLPPHSYGIYSIIDYIVP